ncbi:MAG: RAD55 family ATPase [Gammaproteobacteria bacterium]
MEGWLRRALRPRDNLDAYYQAFSKHLFGVPPNGIREFSRTGRDPHWPELYGDVPDFGVLLQILFNQPTAVRGLDEALGGLMSTVPETALLPGGLVTLITGPPGSGKTSLCLSIAARMAQFGAIVRYVATEEAEPHLWAKLTALAASTTQPLWPAPESEDSIGAFERTSNFRIVPNRFPDFSQLATELRDELSRPALEPDKPSSSSSLPLFLVFPRVVVIDSLTPVLRRRTPDGQMWNAGDDNQGRRDFSRALEILRSMGVCALLVGGNEERGILGIEYLVDNVLSLAIEEDPSRRAAQRIMVVEKTRHQLSDRGGHVFQLSSSEGCVVRPSLDSVLRSLDAHAPPGSNASRRAVLYVNEKALRDRQEHQADLFSPSGGGEFQTIRWSVVTVRQHSQTLVYGRGSAGKARFGLFVALEPRVDWSNDKAIESYLRARAARRRDLTPMESAARDDARILVLSFLYDVQYYRAIGEDFFHYRYGDTPAMARDRSCASVEVLPLRPGYIDPETIVSEVRHKLDSARLSGAPFSAVLIDGVHNILVDFPMLQREPLLWATLYSLLRAEGVETVTTFTFFELARFAPAASDRGKPRTELVTTTVGDRERLFFHLLVSSCDHTFLVERDDLSIGRPTGRINVSVVSTVDAYEGQETLYQWDAATFSYVRPVSADEVTE